MLHSGRKHPTQLGCNQPTRAKPTGGDVLEGVPRRPRLLQQRHKRLVAAQVCQHSQFHLQSRGTGGETGLLMSMAATAWQLAADNWLQ